MRRTAKRRERSEGLVRLVVTGTAWCEVLIFIFVFGGRVRFFCFVSGSGSSGKWVVGNCGNCILEELVRERCLLYRLESCFGL